MRNLKELFKNKNPRKVGFTSVKLIGDKLYISHDGNMGNRLKNVSETLELMGLPNIQNLKWDYEVESEDGSPDYMYSLVIDLEKRNTQEWRDGKFKELLVTQFQPIMEIREYYDGGPNDRGEFFGYMHVEKDMFKLGQGWQNTKLVPNDKFEKSFTEKFGIENRTGNYQPSFVTKDEHFQEVTKYQEILKRMMVK